MDTKELVQPDKTAFSAFLRFFSAVIILLCSPIRPFSVDALRAATLPADSLKGSGKSTAHLALTPLQLFDLAEQAGERGNHALAEKLLRALASNPDIETRSEARFRLAMLLAQKEHRLRDAATLLRQILDEKPKAARVWIELAKIQTALGNIASAEAGLRAAQLAGLPPEVARDVRFFMQALDARRHFGASIEATLMPDTNINRGTSVTTVGTQLGDLVLSPDARKHAGLGLNLRGQTYVRLNLSDRVRFLAQLSGAGTAYRASRFDDFTASPLVGPEFSLHDDRVTVLVGPSWRWFGVKPYTASVVTTAAWQHAQSPRTALRVDGSYERTANRLNSDESGSSYTLAVGFDRAISTRLGAGAQVRAFRRLARLAAYSLTVGGISAYAFRDIGHLTVSAVAAYSHLEADDRLILFPRRRIDDACNLTLSTTLRNIRLSNVSPVFRIRYEANFSSLEIYQHRRLSAEIGLSTSF
ncbi:surface lipoprotein assembly modifier [Rhizorhabdus argentea]|uniref:surface lipoprotein assembly modifier n=1 Tax=Rhizorhabdus argentea TaxID=1387174 RepID=UPI0030ED578E